MVLLVPDDRNLADFEEKMTAEMFNKYFDVNFRPTPDDEGKLMFKENVVNLTLPLFAETYVNQHLDKSLLQVSLFMILINFFTPDYLITSLGMT